MLANASSASSTVIASTASGGSQARSHDRCRQLGGIREPPRQHEQHAEHEHPGRRDEVAEAGAPPRRASVAREARVVGDQRHPRDGDRDHEVHPDPEREAALGLGVPELGEVGLGERPPGQVPERREHDVHRVAADEAAHDGDGPHQRERGGNRAEDERPEPLRADADQLVGQRCRGGGDDDQLERRPAPALQRVQHRRRVRADAAERRAHQHHPGNARVCTDQSRAREHRVADQPAEQNREQRVAKRERRHEERADHDHEQRDAERSPEQRLVDQAEDPKALGHGLDAPDSSCARPRRAWTVVEVGTRPE